jgi:endonuclease/exonuclease/phosphatase family metal-dependent hydrolase
LLELEEALPGYDREGVGREDGKRAGEYSALFFKRERFERVDGGTFWLSATPRVPGKGWDAACERVVTWVKLRERASGGIFLVFNTHFDHVGSVARRESALLLKRRAREIAGDAPVIVTGDFNATADGEPMQLLVNDPDRLVNASEATPRFTGPRHSYHDFGRLPAERRQLIDHILVKNARAVTLVQVLDLQATGSYISDHYPVLAIVEISPK